MERGPRPPATRPFGARLAQAVAGRDGRRLLIVLGVLLTLAASGASAATRYVETTGTDNPTCAIATPCRTVLHAVTNAASGDTIKIGKGKFVEASTVVVNVDMTIEGAGIFSTRVSAKPNGVFHISNGVNAVITRLDIMGGSADAGGGVLNWGNLAISDARVWQNYAVGQGGGIANYGQLWVSRTEIARNVAGIQGGGIYNGDGVVILDEVRVVVNATEQPHGGGGIVSEGAPWAGVFSLDATRSEISHNEGGGIVTSGPMSLVNSTVSRNTKYGIYTGPGDYSQLIHVTVAENGAGAEPGFKSGGLAADMDSSYELINTIVANNVGVQCDLPPGLDAIVEATGSLIGDNSCAVFPGGTNLVGVDPKLWPLQYDKSSLTWTHALKPGSPAVDAGLPGACAPTDQRGVLRAVDGNGDGIVNCDIGAHEYLPLKRGWPTEGGP